MDNVSTSFLHSSHFKRSDVLVTVNSYILKEEETSVFKTVGFGSQTGLV